MTTRRRRRAVVAGCLLALGAVFAQIGFAAWRLHVFEPRARHEKPVFWLSLSKDGSRLFSAALEQDEFLVRDLDNPFERWRGARASRRGGGFRGCVSPDGRFLLVVRVARPEEEPPGGTADDNLVLELFSIDAWRTVRRLEVGAIRDIAFAPDGETFAWASKTGLHIGKLPDGIETAARPPGFAHHARMLFTRDGREILTSEGSEVHIEDAATGRPLRRLALSPDETVGAGMALSPDGRTLFASNHSDVVAFDLATGAERWRTSHPSMGFVLEPSPDGRLVFLCEWYHGTSALDATTGVEASKVWDDVMQVAFAPDHDLAVLAGRDGSVELRPLGAFLARFH